MLHSCVGGGRHALRAGGSLEDMPQGRAIPPEVVAEARRLYESTTLSELRVSALCAIGQSSLRRYAQRDGWKRPDATERSGLISSLRSRVDAEIVAAEAAMDAAAAEKASDIDKVSRNLASLVRTLRELAKFDDEQARRASGRGGAGTGVDGGDESANGDVSDLDELRATLARRLEGLRGQDEF